MEPKNTGVVAIDDPGTSQGAAQANTLDNLGANVDAEISSQQADASAGAAPDATTPAPGEPGAAPATPVEGTPPAEAGEAKMQRISQDNANLRTTLTKLGIKPDSDVAEQLRTGLITYDDIVRSRTPVAPAATVPEASTPTAPEVSLEQKIDNLRSVLNKPIGPEGIGAENIKEQQTAFLDVIAGQAQEIDNIKQSQEKKESTEKANRMVAATNDVFNAEIIAGLSAEIPEDVRQIGAEMFLGATDIENISLIETHGKEKAVTVDGYRYSATQVAPKMKQFIQAIYKAGQVSMNPNPTPNPPVTPAAPRTSVNALRPGGGGPSPSPPVPKDKFDINNLVANVDEELARQRQGGQV